MGDDAWHGCEGLEIAIILISELEVIRVQRVLLEADAQSIENKLIVGELHIIRGPFSGEDLLNIHYGGSIFLGIDHFVYFMIYVYL